jgi:predicted amidophosphoribosyltransferase
MAVCAICGTDLPRGARFCPNCGSAVAEAQRGTILDEADRTFEQLRATKAQEMVRKVRTELDG